MAPGRRLKPLLSLHYIIILNCFINLHTCDTTCQFPAEWTGDWFERDETDYVRIQNGTISTKGTCIHHEPFSNKYILRHPIKKSYLCVVIHQKHINLLQYKQSFWHMHYNSLPELCDSITGDNPLLSTFRVNANPVPCPFTGHFTLTYNRGHRDCVEPKSTIDPCTDNSRLHFKFQACYDVPKSQSSEEQLECLASWREGPDKYVVGKMYRRLAKTDSELYRCFVYSTNEVDSGYEVAESADASCDGVFLSPLTGARIMKLQRVHQDEVSCSFPKWMSQTREWNLLNRNKKYSFNSQNTSISVADKQSFPNIESIIRCVKTLSSNDQISKYIVHVTVGCESGYKCMEVFNRNKIIVQYKQGKISRYMDAACTDKYYNRNMADYITLKGRVSVEKPEITGSISQAVTDIKYPSENTASENSKSSITKCPYHGEYIAKNSIIRNSIKPGCNTSYMSIGCQSEYSMEVHAKCSSSTHKDRFYCHGNWTVDHVHYIVASHLETKNHYCFVYREHEDGLYFSVFQSCPDEPKMSSPRGDTNRILFHKKGQCSDENSSSLPFFSTKLLFSTAMSLLLLSFYS